MIFSSFSIKNKSLEKKKTFETSRHYSMERIEKHQLHWFGLKSLYIIYSVSLNSLINNLNFVISLRKIPMDFWKFVQIKGKKENRFEPATQSSYQNGWNYIFLNGVIILHEPWIANTETIAKTIIAEDLKPNMFLFELSLRFLSFKLCFCNGSVVWLS